MKFRSENEAVLAYENNVVTLHARIQVLREAEIDGEKQKKTH